MKVQIQNLVAVIALILFTGMFISVNIRLSSRSQQVSNRITNDVETRFNDASSDTREWSRKKLLDFANSMEEFDSK